MVRKLPANAGYPGELGLIPGSERSPGVEMVTHSSILAWKIPWTEQSGGLQSMGHKQLDTTEHAHAQLHIIMHLVRC